MSMTLPSASSRKPKPTAEQKPADAEEAEKKALPPLAERPATDILAAILEVFWIARTELFRARGELYVICDRGAVTKAGAVPAVVARELPMREAAELLAWTLRPYPVGHEWRWRLCLCPTHQRTREGIHVLLMEPPKKGRPRSEPVWMRSEEADQRGRRRPEPGSPATTRVGVAREPEKDRRAPREPASTRRPQRPKKRTLAQDAQPPRATMGAEL